MNKIDITNNTYKTRTITGTSDVSSFESISNTKRVKMQNIVSNFFSYIKAKHS